MKVETKGLEIAVLYGGRSRERPGSLRSGDAVMEGLRELGHRPIAVDPHPMDSGILKTLAHARCAFLALHGRYGEDGKIQGLLELLDIPYTGSGVAASAAAMDKLHFKRLVAAEQIPTPVFSRVGGDDPRVEAERCGSTVEFPAVVKPVSEGGSLGIRVCADERQLQTAIRELRPEFGSLMVERFITGAFVTVGVLGSFGAPDVLPPLRVHFDGPVYDYEIKHTKGLSRYVVPADIGNEISASIVRWSESIYHLLGCHGPLRVDWLCPTVGEPLVLEANTVPGLSRMGNLAAIAEGAGIGYNALIGRILESAFNRPQYST